MANATQNSASPKNSVQKPNQNRWTGPQASSAPEGPVGVIVLDSVIDSDFGSSVACLSTLGQLRQVLFRLGHDGDEPGHLARNPIQAFGGDALRVEKRPGAGDGAGA